MRRFLCLLVAALAVGYGGCDCLIDLLPIPDCVTSTFEVDLDGWQARGTDLSEPPIPWSIERSEEMAKCGVASAKFSLENINDAGKIWLEQTLTVEPNTHYRVWIRYDFATADFGFVNLWRIITGVSVTQPQKADDLNFEGDTGNGADSDVGYQWLRKRFAYDVESDENGVLYVTIGVWGTWESPRTYYVDNVRVCLVEE